jgi:hypothetical protein
MSASVGDYQLSATAAGFTLGFGFLTVWEAIQQTRRNRNPLRSAYIYMVWGEIIVNICIGIVGWLFLAGTLGPTYAWTLPIHPIDPADNPQCPRAVLHPLFLGL